MYYTYLIFIFIIVFAFYLFFKYLSQFPIFRFIPIDTKKVPYAVINDNVFSESECKHFVQQISNCQFITDNPLNEGFTNSRGIVIKFTDNNLLLQLTKYNLAFLHDIFTKIKDPECNTFIFNALIIKPISNLKDTTQIVKKHHDCTISINEKHFPYRGYLPKCVTVIYIQLPISFNGGQLDLFTFNGFSDIPEQTIMPKIGRVVVFRGDLQHSVQSFHSEQSTPRMSLVFEQYKLPDNVKPQSLFNIHGHTV